MRAFHYLSLSLSFMGVGVLLPVTGNTNPFSSGSMPTGQFPPLAQPPQPSQYAPYRQQAYTMPSYSANSYQAMPYQNTPPHAMQYGQPAYRSYPYQQQPSRHMNYQTPHYQFSNINPFGNTFSPTNMFSNNNFPSPWQNTGQWNPWQNGNNANMPFFPNQHNSNQKKAWGDTRNIWPDFYTGFTEEFWDQGSNAPYDMGRMPGGWRAPSLSSPDPVTVGDAVLNQFPPIMEEMGNMMDFSN